MTFSRNVILKLSKVKGKKKLRQPGEKILVNYKVNSIRLSTDFSAETLQARREWNDTIKILKDKTISKEYSIKQSYHSDIKEI